MQIQPVNSERKSNSRVLSPHRHTRLRQGLRPEFRDQLVEPNDIQTVLVNLAGGACRTLQAVLETEGDR